jgi:glutamate/tyrosine decarboxylase-like PLP-dependent enzyme
MSSTKPTEQKMKQWEIQSASLSPDPETFEQWMNGLRGEAEKFLKEIQTKEAYSGGEKKLSYPRALHHFAKEIQNCSNPNTPKDFKKVISQVFENIDSAGINTAAPGFLGYIPGGGVPLAAVGDFIGALTNRYSSFVYTSPAAALVENELIYWLRSLFGLPNSAWGTITSGGATANLLALLAARETREVEAWQRGVIYTTRQSHHTLSRALKILGLQRTRVRLLESKQGRLPTAELKEVIEQDKKEGLEPWIILANAGTTNLGAVDPLEEIADISEKNKLWMHVDAAYGGFFQLIDYGKKAFKGIERSDSLTVDPHKALFMPYGCGAVMVKQASHLKSAMHEEADYLSDLGVSDSPSPGDFTFELTRPFRALRVWLPLKIHGQRAFEAALEEKRALALWTYEQLHKTGLFEMGPEPDLTVLAFRFKGFDEQVNENLTLMLQEKLIQKGDFYLSNTKLDQNTYLRICVLSFRTHLSDMKNCVRQIEDFSNALIKEKSKK